LREQNYYCHWETKSWLGWTRKKHFSWSKDTKYEVKSDFSYVIVIVWCNFKEFNDSCTNRGKICSIWMVLCNWLKKKWSKNYWINTYSSTRWCQGYNVFSYLLVNRITLLKCTKPFSAIHWSSSHCGIEIWVKPLIRSMEHVVKVQWFPFKCSI